MNSMQAADYLGDEEGCCKLCRKAAQVMLPHPPSHTGVGEAHIKVRNTLSLLTSW